MSKGRPLAVTILAALAAWLPAVSQQPPQESVGTVYNVELVIFRDTAGQGGAENWALEAADSANLTSGEESASSGSQLGRMVGLLPASAFQLNEVESRLRAAGGYVPVAHAAWSQTASAWGTRAGFTVQRLGIDVPGLTGNVFLERGQYLHLGMTLSYAITTPPASLGAGPGTVFTLSESRRVRFYDRNYYDHPAFGVIALVTPAKGARPPGR